LVLNQRRARVSAGSKLTRVRYGGSSRQIIPCSQAHRRGCGTIMSIRKFLGWTSSSHPKPPIIITIPSPIACRAMTFVQELCSTGSGSKLSPQPKTRSIHLTITASFNPMVGVKKSSPHFGRIMSAIPTTKGLPKIWKPWVALRAKTFRFGMGISMRFALAAPFLQNMVRLAPITAIRQPRRATFHPPMLPISTSAYGTGLQTQRMPRLFAGKCSPKWRR